MESTPSRYRSHAEAGLKPVVVSSFLALALPVFAPPARADIAPAAKPAARAEANAPVGSIEGVLCTKDGKPVIAATVALVELDKSTYSATHGVFFFTEIPEGEYTVVARDDKNAYISIEKIRVRAGTVADLGFLTVGTTSEPVKVAAAPSYIAVIEKVRVYETSTKGFVGNSIDLQRSQDDAMPYVTFTNKDLALSGASTLNEFLTKRLPMNVADANFGATASTSGLAPVASLNIGNWNSKASSVSTNSRSGLAAAVVVLVDGVPAPALVVPNQGGYGQPDINGLPLDMIERIEVLPAASSSLYGPNASGGVINIITKSGYTGGGVTARYEQHTGASDGSQSYSANYTMSLPGGVSMRVVGSFQHDKPLTIGDSQQQIERLRERTAAYFPSSYFGSYVSPVVGATPNFRVYGSGTDGLFGAGTSQFGTVKYGTVAGAGAAGISTDGYGFNFSLPSGRVAGGLDANIGYSKTDRSTVSAEFTKRWNRDWTSSFGVSAYELRFQNDADLNSGSLTYKQLDASSALNYSPFST